MVMNVSALRRTVAGAIVGLSVLVLLGCSGAGSGSSSSGSGSASTLDGFYHGVMGGPITLTIKGGKATLNVANESKTMDYKVVGNKLTILNPKEGDIVFTINDDGTLNGELGIMTKKSS